VETVVIGPGTGVHASARVSIQPGRWARALRTGLTLGLFAAAAWPADEAATEPGEIRFVRQAAGMDDVAPAVFPHWVHRMAYTCYACHDGLFKMKTGETLVTMDQIQSGQSCGACHDGKTAFISNLSTCNRCHR
jgi:c(7)-type cytochrome triheme protein